MASSSSSSSSFNRKTPMFSAFDVYLSFRGSDTRKGFTADLYERLQHHGIKTFMDDGSLEAGERIDKLFHYIQHSKIFVVILSEHYGDSIWCLKELSAIFQTGRLILPVFYRVEPSDARHQSGAFGAAFNKAMKYQKAEDVREWRRALETVGRISGYVVTGQSTDGDEAALSMMITTSVFRSVEMPVDVAKHLVSIPSRVEELLHMQPKDKEDKVSILAITGIGGIGKSTLAWGLYNHLMRGFDACCFLSNVRQKTMHKGLVSLQEQLIHDIVKPTLYVDVDVDDIDRGKLEIRRALLGKKVLLVLDDVDRVNQLDALAGEKDWFSKGSIVIITTRNNAIARNHYQSEDCLLYQPKHLNDDESMELFSLHVFYRTRPPPEFEEISWKFVKAARGVPSALTSYGSRLFAKRGNMAYWRTFLQTIEKISLDDVFERLKLSYDDLTESEKAVFLDIAEFYMGENIEYPMYIWEARDLYPTIIIGNLVERNLIKIVKGANHGKSQCFWMHDSIQDMAKYIILQESTWPPAPRIVIRKKDELTNALNNQRVQLSETEQIEGIICTNREDKEVTFNNHEAFDAMPNLQILRIDGVTWGGKFFPRFPLRLRWLQLRFLKTEEFPWDALMNLEQLVILDLSWSSIKRFRSSSYSKKRRLTTVEKKMADISTSDQQERDEQVDPSLLLQGQLLRYLKVLNLSYCWHLEELPDLRRCPELVKLDLSGCSSLRRIDDGSNNTIARLQSLRHLLVNNCKSLETLPALPESLVTLDAYGCSSLTRISDLSTLINLERRDLEACMNLITRLPSLEEPKTPKSLVPVSSGSSDQLPIEPGSLSSQLSQYQEAVPDFKKSELGSYVDILQSSAQLHIEPGSLTSQLSHHQAAVPDFKKSELGSIKRLHHRKLTISDITEPLSTSMQLQQFKYDVFLSFHIGQEQKGGLFASYLYDSLMQHGMHVCNINELGNGDDENSMDIRRSAIDSSAIFIGIFSEDYIQSRLCYVEITAMIQSGRMIIPVCLDGLDPKELLNEKGLFFSAIQNHQEGQVGKNIAHELIEVLTQAKGQPGFMFDGPNMGQAEIVQSVVHKVRGELTFVISSSSSVCPTYRHMEDLLSKVEPEEADVRIIQIKGASGIGKTTMAKAVYNENFNNFDSSSYISNVKEKSRRPGGLVELQKQLIRDIQRNMNSEEETESTEIVNVQQGKLKIEEVIHSRSVLLVLDNVDGLEQLHALVTSKKCYQARSRIIITTRVALPVELGFDKSIIYYPQVLDNREFSLLFRYFAFKIGGFHDPQGYLNFSRRAAVAIGGIPLCIEVLGSLFKNLETEIEREERLKSIEKHSNSSIQEKLKLCLSKLNNLELFLFFDIAFFFVGMEVETAFHIWKGDRLPPAWPRAFTSLLEKSLVKISHGKIEMHEVLCEVAESIMEDKYPEKPYLGSCNMLYDHQNEKGSVRGITLEIDHASISSHGTTLDILDNLKLLQINSKRHSKRQDGLDFPLPKELKWLQWHGCPSMSVLSIDFSLAKLVVLDLSQSDIKDFGNGTFPSIHTAFKSLEVLVLDGCKNLEEGPDFKHFPSLVRLILDNCSKLSTLGESVGRLGKLEFLSLKGCEALKALPEDICDLSNLCHLNMTSCKKIRQLPHNFKQLSNLKFLSLEGMSELRDLPNNLADLRCLNTLLAGACGCFKNGVPVDFGAMQQTLQVLVLQGNKFRELPSSIRSLSELKVLSLCNCENLIAIPPLPASLIKLFAWGCTSLELIPDVSSLKNLELLDLRDCNALR